jgi:hypothetical protein
MKFFPVRSRNGDVRHLIATALTAVGVLLGLAIPGSISRSHSDAKSSY